MLALGWGGGGAGGGLEWIGYNSFKDDWMNSTTEVLFVSGNHITIIFKAPKYFVNFCLSDK